MIEVFYTDGTSERFSTITDAEQGIIETVRGCDFAVTVDCVADAVTGVDYGCDWSLSLVVI